LNRINPSAEAYGRRRCV